MIWCADWMVRIHEQSCSKDPRRAPLRVDFPSAIKIACSNALDALVSLVFEFMDQPLLPSQVNSPELTFSYNIHSTVKFIFWRSCETIIVQRNFAPVSELGEAIKVDNIEGKIPDDFPVGVYIRNGNDMHCAKYVSRSECFISSFSHKSQTFTW